MDWPNEKEKTAAASRERRLEGAYGAAVKVAVDKTITDLSAPGRLAAKGLVLRTGFVYRATPAPGYASDRRVPKREHRPPATRIGSSQGAALRLYLMALAENQIRLRAGAGTTNPLPIDGRGSVSWIDLVASTADRSTSPSGTYLNAKDKMLRTVTGGLRTLERAKLVYLPNAAKTKGKFEQFVLLDDAGSGADYELPRKIDDTFSLPAAFITNGWLHVLEDSEIALLLMVACGRQSEPFGPGMVAINGETRLLHYGIGRDPFTAAHRSLEQFGLLNVHQVDRWPDGRAMENARSLHRLELLPAGFEEDALATVLKALKFATS